MAGEASGGVGLGDVEPGRLYTGRELCDLAKIDKATLSRARRAGKIEGLSFAGSPRAIRYTGAAIAKAFRPA